MNLQKMVTFCRLRAFLSSDNILRQWDIASDLRLAIVKVLREHKIQMASPIRKVIMSGDTDAIKQ